MDMYRVGFTYAEVTGAEPPQQPDGEPGSGEWPQRRVVVGEFSVYAEAKAAQRGMTLSTSDLQAWLNSTFAPQLGFQPLPLVGYFFEKFSV